jgi:hypothetical protein
MNVDTAIGLAPAGNVPSLKRRMACFVYEGMMLFGIGLVPGAIGAMFTALTGHTHPLQSDTSLRVHWTEVSTAPSLAAGLKFGDLRRHLIDRCSCHSSSPRLL